MEKLEASELLSISGGGLLSFIKSGIIGIAIAGVFIASVIYGYIHPNSCS